MNNPMYKFRTPWYDLVPGVAYKVNTTVGGEKLGENAYKVDTTVGGEKLGENYEFSSFQYLNAIPPSCRLDVVLMCDHTNFARHCNSGTRMLLWQPEMFRGSSSQLNRKLSENKIISIMYNFWGRWSIEFITNRYSVSVLPYIAGEQEVNNDAYYQKLRAAKTSLERKKIAQERKQAQMGFLKTPRLDRRRK